jgi:hypothetical protein
MKLMMMVALPLQRHRFWRRFEMEPAKRLGGITPMSRGNFQPTVRHADADRGAKVVTQLTGET